MASITHLLDLLAGGSNASKGSGSGTWGSLTMPSGQTSESWSAMVAGKETQLQEMALAYLPPRSSLPR